MVLVDIRPEQIKAFDLLLKDAKAPIEIGYLLGTFRIAITEAIAKEAKKKNKETARKILEEDKPKEKKDDKKA